MEEPKTFPKAPSQGSRFAAKLGGFDHSPQGFEDLFCYGFGWSSRGVGRVPGVQRLRFWVWAKGSDGSCCAVW